MMSVLSVWKKAHVEVFSAPTLPLPNDTSTNALRDLCLLISVTMVKPAMLWIQAQQTHDTVAQCASMHFQQVEERNVVKTKVKREYELTIGRLSLQIDSLF